MNTKFNRPIFTIIFSMIILLFSGIAFAQDSDGDSIDDAVDNCPLVSNTDQADVDSDGIGDVCDNCPDLVNPGQVDTDNDGIGDACDAYQTIVYNDEIMFINDISSTSLINFEDLDTSGGKVTFVGNEYAASGITFAIPSSYGMWVYPQASYWGSNHLSPGEAPFENAGDDTEDSLAVYFNPAVTAIGWKFIDLGNYTIGEYIKVYAEDDMLLAFVPIPSPGTGPGPGDFFGIYSPDKPIARVEIVEAANDGDDVAYDDFMYVLDTDGDGVPDSSDNCPNVYNADQADFDSDGIGDVCDSDSGRIEGTVTGPGGILLAGVGVTICDADGNGIIGTVTDDQGNYAIVVHQGNWKVVFNPWSLNEYYLLEWYNNQIGYDPGEIITVSPGETITGINASIDIGGRIAGIVTDVFNNPLSNIPVTAFDLNYQWMGSAPTDSNGNYGFSLPAGNYKVFFDSNPSDYYVLSEWNNNKASFETADVISVATGETSDVSVELAASGKISGRVTDGINGIQGVSVAACYSDGTCLYGAETDSDGNYVLKAPAGNWKVYFNNYRLIGYFVNEWYNDKGFDLSNADLVSVTVGATTIINEELVTGGKIAGRVIDSLNPDIGIANIAVDACDETNCIYSVGSDSNGNYSLNVPDGQWKVLFHVWQQDSYFLTEWFDNQRNSLDADWVNVAKEQTTTNVNAQLETGGKVAGTVTDANGNPLANIAVTAFDLTNNWMGGAPTDSNGYYGFSVPEGNYKVFFDSNPSDYYVLSEWNDDKASFETADVVSVTTGQTSGVSVQLAPSGKISGRVTDGVNGIPGVSVAACNSDGNCLYGTETDSDGNYVLKVPAGNWKVYFNNYRATEYFVNEWYNDKSYQLSEADVVTVTEGATISGINAVLDIGGKIAGHVTDNSNNALAGVAIGVNDSFANGINNGGTDSAGNYAINVPAGEWKVHFNPSPVSGYYLFEWYNDKGNDFGNADLVTVTVEATTTIDEELETGGKLTGRVTDSSGIGVANVGVSTNDMNGLGYGCSGTDSDGYYSCIIPPGSYRVFFDTSWLEGFYAPEWYDNKNVPTGANYVSVLKDQTTPNIDVQLETGGKIAGRVVRDGGMGIANVAVSAHDMNNTWMSGVSTDAMGYYSFNAPVGELKVAFNPYNAGDYYVFEWYDEHGYDFNNADIVSVTAENITSVNEELATGGRISGRITSTTGEPLPDVCVNFATSNCAESVGITRTDGDGNYNLGSIAPGTYYIVAYASCGSSRNHFDEWWDGDKGNVDCTLASPVTVLAEQITTGIDFDLEPGGTISGVVLDQNTGLPPEPTNIGSVYLSQGWHKFIYRQEEIDGGDSASAAFKAPGDVDWRLFSAVELQIKTSLGAEAESGIMLTNKRNNCTTHPQDHNALLLCVDVDSTEETGWFGQSVVNTINQNNNIHGNDDNYVSYYEAYFYVEEAGDWWFSTSSDDASELVIDDQVVASWYDWHGSMPWEMWEYRGFVNFDLYNESSDSWEGIGNTFIMSDGSYSKVPLQSGEYRVCADRSGYFYECYLDTYDWNTATTVIVNAPDETPNINFGLTFGGSISGRVTDAVTGDGQGDIRVFAVNSNGDTVSNVRTDADGYYAITTLLTGDYKVFFFAPNNRYATQWYSNKGDYFTADWVSVTMPNDTPAINVVLFKGRDILASPAYFRFGYVDIGSSSDARTTTIRNPGTEDLHIGTVSLTGTNPGDFSQVNTCEGRTLAPAETCSVTVIFSPLGADRRTAFVTIQSDDPNTPLYNVSLSGYGILTQNTGNISGRVTDGINGVPDVNVTVYDADYNIISTVITGSDGSYSVPGVLTGNYKLYFDSGGSFAGQWYDAKGDFFSANLLSVLAPNTTSGIDVVLIQSQNIFITPSFLDFGSANVGMSSYTHTVPITNNGSLPLTVETISVIGYDADQFSVSDSCSGQVLNSQQTCTVNVVFTPTAAGSKVASLIIESDDPDTQTFDVPLMGESLFQGSDDIDGDGISNSSDNCPGVANPDQSDIDADGIGDACDSDADGDGIDNKIDNCPWVSNPLQENYDSDGYGNACDDSDYDLLTDDVDPCPNDFDNDKDGDGICAGQYFNPPKTGDNDNCPGISNPDQLDSDGDGEGDVCEIASPAGGPCNPSKQVCTPTVTDTDNDGVPDASEKYCGAKNCKDYADCDGDGVGDSADNCLCISNSDQLNTDGDSMGNACDPDDDNDGVLDGSDNCLLIANATQTDTDCDSFGDACDEDIDGDGLLPEQENFKGTSLTNWDTDNDKISDGPYAPLQCAGITPLGYNDTTPLGDPKYTIALAVHDESGADITDTWLPSLVWDSTVQGWKAQPVHIVATLKTPTGGFTNFTTNVTLTISEVSSFEGRAVNDTESCSGVCSNDFSFDAVNTDVLQKAVTVGAPIQSIGTNLYAFDFGGYVKITATTMVGTAQVSGTLALPVDSDYDRLPDVWEEAWKDYGFDKNNNKSLNPDKDDGNADIDASLNNAYQGDGLTNFREYRGILLDKLTKDNAGKVTGIVVKGEHQRLNPRVKDLFVRGDGYLNSTECGPSSTNKPLYCSDTDILTFTIVPLGGEASFTNAFEHAGIAVHNVTGMPSFYAYDGANEATRYLEPPNIDILVVKNETSTTNTIVGSADGYINLVAVRYWTWDTKGAAYFGDANSYHIWVNQTTGTISRGAFTYHLNLMNYFYNRPYFDVSSSDGLYVANAAYNGLLDPQSLVEDRILENGALEITRKTSTNEDNNPADGKMRGDHIKTDWKLKAGGVKYRTGYNFSTFDANANGLVELPVVSDAAQIDKEYTPLKVQRQTIIHEMGHAAGIRNPEHPCEEPNVMCVPVVDWEKAGSFSIAGQQQLLIHNKTE